MLIFQPCLTLSEQQQKEMGIISSEHTAYITVDENGNYFFILDGTDIQINIAEEAAEQYLANGIAAEKGGMGR